jgi:hypothetical protein
MTARLAGLVPERRYPPLLFLLLLKELLINQLLNLTILSITVLGFPLSSY